VPEWQSAPGATPIADRSGLKIKSIVLLKDLYEFEARNIERATLKYLVQGSSRKKARFDLSWALKLHREMFGMVWAWAGKPRTCDLNLGVPWPHVETSLQTLFGNLAFWENSGMDVHEQAARLHHEAARIHPFLNGNGRWARMLGNIWLRRCGQAPTQWPSDASGPGTTIRPVYLAALQAADGGDIDPLVALHKKYAIA
jgi:Fic-DOC domain mobile mystery protein B